MPVPYTFGTATASIPLSQLDSNFATAITIGNTAVQLGNTVTTLNNMTLANVTISSGNVTITNVTVTTANATTANVGTLVVTSNATVGGNISVTGNVSMNVATITTSNVTTENVSSLIVTGNQTFVGTGNRITGDFSNGTISNGVVIQTSTTNGATSLAVAPNGSSAISGFFAVSGLTANESLAQFRMVGGTDMRLNSTITGTGTYLPMTFYTGGSEKMRVDTSGNVGIGTSSPSSYGSPLSVYAATNPTLAVASGNANAYLRLYSTSDNNMYLTNTGGSMTMITANTERMRIDSSGNLGLGVTPSAWGSAYKMFQASSQASFGGNSSNITIVGSNYYNDGASKYIGTGLAALYLQDAGVHKWYNAPSGTAGNAITFTQAMTLDASGNLQMQAGAVMPYAPAPASISTTATLTNANIQAQIINTTGTTYTVTMPLGTTLETLATWATTNVGYDFFVINTATGIITMAVNTGVTSLGLLTIAAATSAHFRIRRTAANTFVLYRLV